MVTGEVALADAKRWSRYPGHDPVLVLSEVTSVGWGSPGPNGSFLPAVDHQLAWILWYTDVELFVIGGAPADPPGTAATTTVQPRGQAIVIVDAATGQQLSTMEGA